MLNARFVERYSYTNETTTKVAEGQTKPPTQRKRNEELYETNRNGNRNRQTKENTPEDSNSNEKKRNEC